MVAAAAAAAVRGTKSGEKGHDRFHLEDADAKDEPRDGPDTEPDLVKPIKTAEFGSETPKSMKSQSSAKKKSNSKAPARGFWKFQPQAEKLYTNMKVQFFVAALIAGNFVCNIVEKWIDPKGTEYPDVFYGMETFFNVIFAVELCVNMYAFWFCRFWRSGWNIFDFIVVAIGILSVAKVELPGPLGMLRMMRAFRVFRLFKRVKSLNKIMVSLAKAVPGVANAFFILLLVMSIYAIIAVDLFKDFGVGGKFTNIHGVEVELISSRKQEYGPEYFGNFGKSLYTMFQVLTCESWAEAIARPLLHCNSVSDAFGVAFFFVSFVIVNGVVLINVVVAVLLEKMVDDDDKKEAHGKKHEEEENEDEEEEEEEKESKEEAAALADFKDSQPMWSSPVRMEAPKQDGAARVAHLRADLDAMKKDMVVIQDSMAVLLGLLNIKPKGALPARSLRTENEGRTLRSAAREDERGQPTLPGAIARE
ncbi:unnamed protein product [Effrenium voratum]|nr:unnamed protein product [Effrenium voratum]